MLGGWQPPGLNQCMQDQRERDSRSESGQEQTDLNSEHLAACRAPRCSYFSHCCWWLLLKARYIESATFLMAWFTTSLSTTTDCFLLLHQYRQLEEDNLPITRVESPGSLDRMDWTGDQPEIIWSYSSQSWFINQWEKIQFSILDNSYDKIGFL